MNRFTKWLPVCLLLLWPLAASAQSVIIGADQTAAQTGQLGPGNAAMLLYQTFTASASGTLATLSMDTAVAQSGSVVLVIYDSTGSTLLGYTSSATIVTGVTTLNLTSSVSITSGTTYILGAYFSAYAELNTDGATVTLHGDDSSLSFPTAPSSLISNDTYSTGVVALWGSTAAAGTCTDAGSTKGGAIAVPNGTSGYYWSPTGNWVTPNCVNIQYWAVQGGRIVVN